ncbi:phage holin family protein [Streptomyces sp. CA-294286]|uniref:phage holin family protein n=1 Tax=Streptomyces sp. CA-294286 TaxID=3240070 RepID=UPI003D8B9B78
MNQPQSAEPSAADLVKRATEQFSELVREELRLARAEMKDKGKKAGIGGGLYGGAGITAFLALQALVATGIAALALVLPVWASGLIVTAILAALAAILALAGRKKTRSAAPLAPEQAAENVRADIQEIKERAQR